MKKADNPRHALPDRGTNTGSFFFASGSVSRETMLLLNMPAFMHLEEGAQQDHQLLLVSSFSSVADWSGSADATANRCRRQFTHRPMTAVGPDDMPERLAPSASGVWALRPSGVAIVCAPNGTLAEIDDVPA